MPDSVTAIGEFAFEGASSLTQIVIGTSVNVIYEGAFRDTSLTRVFYKATNSSQVNLYVVNTYNSAFLNAYSYYYSDVGVSSGRWTFLSAYEVEYMD